MKKADINSQDVDDRIARGESLRSIAQSYGITHQALSLRRRAWGGTPLKKSQRTSGGSFIDQWGYKMTRAADESRVNPYVAEHVIIAEAKIGHRLRANEVVHHIDGMKTNNDPENLLVCTRSEHRRLHRSLEQLAYELVQSGVIAFSAGDYRWAK